MSTHNLCFEQKYEKCQNFLPDFFFFPFLVVKFSIHLNRHVFVMGLQLKYYTISEYLERHD